MAYEYAPAVSGLPQMQPGHRCRDSVTPDGLDHDCWQLRYGLLQRAEQVQSAVEPGQGEYPCDN